MRKAPWAPAVRKGFAFPSQVVFYLEAAPSVWRGGPASKSSKCLRKGKAFPHGGRRSREPL